jgi:C4-dicarboxylate transporter DctM subunit
MLLVLIFLIFALLILISFPMAFCMGASALAVLIIEGKVPPMVVIQRMFVGIDSLPFLAIPFFMLAGSLMERGGISHRLVRFASAMVGHWPGGLGMVSIVSSMIFAGISGSSTADTAAVGSILMPAMVKKGYKKGFVATLQACSGTIGPVIPPSILMIIYGGITGLSIGAMFLSGIIPGILIGIGLMIGAYVYARKEGMLGESKASFKEMVESFLDSLWALLMPVIIIVGILSGVFTATEAGMVAVLYGLIVGLFIYRELIWKDIPKILGDSARSAGSIIIIASMANVFAWVLAKQEFPKWSVEFLSSLSSNPNVIMLLVIIFFLILGCFVDTVAATIIFVPVLGPLIAQFGFDPVHFALVIVVTLLIGQVTPPVGVLLFLTCSMLKISVKEALKYIYPFVAIMIAVLLICAYSESMVMFLPRLFFK